MCDMNCCKDNLLKEEDLLCCIPLQHCCGGALMPECCPPEEPKHCCCHCCDPEGCRLCNNDEECDCECCYCKYYKMLKELRERLDDLESDFTTLESRVLRTENDFRRYYESLLNQFVEHRDATIQDIGDINDRLDKEIADRIADVDAEEARAKAAEAAEQARATGAESALQANIDALDAREAAHDAAQKVYIDTRIENLVDGAPAAFDTLKEIADELYRGLGAESAILTAISNEAATRANADSVLLNNISTVADNLAAEVTRATNAENALRNTINDTANEDATLVFGGKKKIARANGVDITVSVPALPESLKNPYLLSWSGYESGSYDGSAAKSFTIPNKASQLTNDSGYIKNLGVDGNYIKWNVDDQLNRLTVPYATNASNATKATKDANGDTIDSTYLKKADASTVATSGSYNDLSNKPMLGTAAAKDVPASGNASTTQVVMGNDTRLTDARPASDVYSWAKASTKPSYSYSEINGTPTIPTVPTNVSAFTNDAGYITSASLPTVNNGTLTILKNGANVATFTANQSGTSTANITVPTKTSDLTNDSGYTTNIGTVTTVKVGDTSYTPVNGVVSLPAYPTSGTGTSSVTINGTSYTLQEAVDYILQQIGNTGDSLWEVSSSDSSRIVAKNGKAAVAAGFYDSSI